MKALIACLLALYAICCGGVTQLSADELVVVDYETPMMGGAGDYCGGHWSLGMDGELVLGNGKEQTFLVDDDQADAGP